MTEKTMETMNKPLDKMTVKELREVALELPEITGVHGMNKAELLAAIKEVKGIKDTPVKKKVSATIGSIKEQIKSFKKKRESALKEKNAKMATVYRRRIARLKKKSRQLA